MLNASQAPSELWEHSFSVHSWPAPVVSQRKQLSPCKGPGEMGRGYTGPMRMPFPGISGFLGCHHPRTHWGPPRCSGRHGREGAGGVSRGRSDGPFLPLVMMFPYDE